MKPNWTDEDLLNFAISYYNYRQKEPITISDYFIIWANERNSSADRENNNDLSE
jgi:hypothetical protein